MHNNFTEWSFAMSGAAAQWGCSEASVSNPPKLNVVPLKPQDLPEDSVMWKADLWIDILLLTAKECEFHSCLRYLNPDYYKSYKEDLGFVYLGEMGKGDVKLKVAVIRCDMGSGVNGATIVVPKAVRALHPKAVICVGYCAGLKEKKVKFGDIVVSSKLATFAPTKVTGDEIIERGVRVPGSPRLLRMLKSADAGWKTPLEKAEDLEVKVHKDGLLLSGPEVVSSDERRKQLIKRYPDAIGVEMEGEGLYAAAHDLGIEWVVIKGVSDYAGNNKSESDPWREFSSLMAASLVAHILRNANVFQEWPHYEKPEKKTPQI